MKRKVFGSVCMVAMFSMALAALLTMGFWFRDVQLKMRQSVATEARYLGTAMESVEETSRREFLSHLGGTGEGNQAHRITWISGDGEVLYDSYAAGEGLENHGDRPEILSAREKGWGESTRISDTLSEQTYYYAVRLEDGTLIRAAGTARSSLAAAVHTLPWMAVLAAAILGVTMLLAGWQTRRIVEPINRLDPEDPQPENVYDELSPLVRRLRKQRTIIQEQIDTLREKQEEFTAITENMKEGFIVVDSKGDVISYNTSALRILGADTDGRRESGLHVLNLNRSAGFRQAVDAALAGRQGEQELALGGRTYHLLANPVAEAEQKNGAVVVILDVTEQKNREALRREFTANVSHELKTPLTSISGYAEIMKDGLVKPEDMGRFSEKIYQEAQRLITLVGDILKLSQLDEAGGRLEMTPVDLLAVVKEAVGHLKDEAAAGKVCLAVRGEPVTVRGSARILDEMVYNLCDNGIKYNHPGGYVLVTVSCVRGCPAFTVEDNGIGIPASDQERIFERFYRVDKSRSRQVGGTGLGLSIVKHGAACHQAEVEMKSEPGKGTRITVRFPADPAAGERGEVSGRESRKENT